MTTLREPGESEADHARRLYVLNSAVFHPSLTQGELAAKYDAMPGAEREVWVKMARDIYRHRGQLPPKPPKKPKVSTVKRVDISFEKPDHVMAILSCGHGKRMLAGQPIRPARQVVKCQACRIEQQERDYLNQLQNRLKKAAE